MSNNKAEATYHGESELDRAWRTIPAECRGVTPPQEATVLARCTTALRSLATPANIVTVTVTAAMAIMLVVIVLAWFLDWKMP